MKLIDWLDPYIDYLNSFKKNLLSKVIKDNMIICEYKDKGLVEYIASELLNNDIELTKKQLVIVCLNNKANLNFLIKNWEKFVQNPTLKMMFVNPNLNQQWSLLPYIHNKFGDPDSLETGLKSLFDSIPSV